MYFFVQVNAVWKGIGPLNHLTWLQRASYRATLLGIYTLGLAAVLSTIVVSLAAVGSGTQLYNGNIWSEIFGASWMNALIWSFGAACFAEGVDIEMIAGPFVFLLVSSIIGGWSCELADPGYKGFYEIFPFHWSIYMYRSSLYKTMPQEKIKSAMILLGEALFFIVLYFLLAYRRGTSPVTAPTSVTVGLQEKELQYNSGEVAA